MRLNKNTYPAFDVLESGNIQMLEIDAMFYDEVKSEEELTKFIKQLDFGFREVKKKYYITEPFKEAIVKASEKINKDLKHIQHLPSEDSLFFTENGFTIINPTPDSDKTIAVIYGFTRNVMTSYAILKRDLTFNGFGATIKDGKPYNDLQHVGHYINSVLTTLYFVHNCEVEQKLVQPKQKVKTDTGKHFNESKSDIIILNCSWFTELIRNIPYGVSGHFRWQPCGEKFNKRKLIWIEEFQKQGYKKNPKKVEI